MYQIRYTLNSTGPIYLQHENHTNTTPYSFICNSSKGEDGRWSFSFHLPPCTHLLNTSCPYPPYPHQTSPRALTTRTLMTTQEVARGLDIPKATALQREFLAAGGAPSLKFTGRLIRMHGKQRGVTTSLALYESSKHMCEGHSSEAHFYGAVITACARVSPRSPFLPTLYTRKLPTLRDGISTRKWASDFCFSRYAHSSTELCVHEWKFGAKMWDGF